MKDLLIVIFATLALVAAAVLGASWATKKTEGQLQPSTVQPTHNFSVESAGGFTSSSHVHEMFLLKDGTNEYLGIIGIGIIQLNK